MSRQRSKKPKPRLSPTLFVADKQRAAIGQLESAILLWFNEADPISILVLASRAHDCYHALGKKIRKPSWHQEFIEKMPCSFQERAKYIQDFAKHGFKDLDESTPFDTTYAEGLMLVSIDRHREIFGRLTPLMGIYLARAFSEHPTWTQDPQSLPKVLVDSGIIEDVARGSRKQCFDSFYALFTAAFAAFPPAFHSGSPPER
ncbi:MAG: hypothetical protein DMG96_15955 [Acidobacteria bacterium]|nr:MAG: hypothetical protein DMG96_15955 [Acidobacteriota bacterium]